MARDGLANEHPVESAIEIGVETCLRHRIERALRGRSFHVRPIGKANACRPDSPVAADTLRRLSEESSSTPAPIPSHQGERLVEEAAAIPG